MALRTTTNVSLTPEFDRFISKLVKSGRYQSASEVVRAALRILQREQAVEEAALKEVCQKIAVGLKQLDRGDVHAGQTVFAELRRRSRARRRMRA